MEPTTTPAAPPEHNVTGIDYADRLHLRYGGPLIDFHSHVMVTRPGDSQHGPSTGTVKGGSTGQAEMMAEVAREFGVVRIVTMCPAEDIPRLREKFGDFLVFNGSISKKLEEPDDVAYQLLDNFLKLGVQIIKLWAAPRGRERGLFVDAPWRIEAVRRAQAAGIRIVMVHVGDPDVWWKKAYADTAKFGTKESQYIGLERMLEMFPDLLWIGAHMGGDPEHADHLEALLERYPHFCLDTSATKWQVRECSIHRDEIRALVCRHPTRFLFGSDLVTRHELPREHYVSRYWCQRTLWESDWEGRSPIADPDFTPAVGEPTTPLLRGLSLPPEVLQQLYFETARRLLEPVGA